MSSAIPPEPDRRSAASAMKQDSSFAEASRLLSRTAFLVEICSEMLVSEDDGQLALAREKCQLAREAIAEWKPIDTSSFDNVPPHQGIERRTKVAPKREFLDTDTHWYQWMGFYGFGSVLLILAKYIERIHLATRSTTANQPKQTRGKGQRQQPASRNPSGEPRWRISYLPRR